MRVPDKSGLDKVRAMKENYYRLNLDCLVVLGDVYKRQTSAIPFIDTGANADLEYIKSR